MAKQTYGKTIEEAHEENVCIKCGVEDPLSTQCYSDAGKKEYKISGLCEKCFDEITRGE